MLAAVESLSNTVSLQYMKLSRDLSGVAHSPDFPYFSTFMDAKSTPYRCPVSQLFRKVSQRSVSYVIVSLESLFYVWLCEALMGRQYVTSCRHRSQFGESWKNSDSGTKLRPTWNVNTEK